LAFTDQKVRARLVEYSDAVVEHYEAAIEALGDMDNIERQMALRVRELVDDGALSADGDQEYQRLRLRFTRLLRLMDRESCATLESLMFEIATLLQIKRKIGSDPETGDWIGFYRSALSEALRATGDPMSVALDAFLTKSRMRDNFRRLAELRRDSYHRAPRPVYEHVIIPNDPTPNPSYFRFFLRGQPPIPVVVNLLDDLHAVLAIVDGAHERCGAG
jgi:hypothetical protein